MFAVEEDNGRLGGSWMEGLEGGLGEYEGGGKVVGGSGSDGGGVLPPLTCRRPDFEKSIAISAIVSTTDCLS